MLGFPDMTRATKVLAVTTILGFATSAYLYASNRSLRSDLEELAPVEVADKPEPVKRDAWLEAKRSKTTLPSVARAPALPEAKDETRMEKRARRTAEFGDQFGRGANETEDEYRARIGPMIKLGLAGPRMKLDEMRRQAEEKARVTPAQSAQLDKAFDKIYEDVIDYTNKAIADGQLSPYERNVAGWLDFAGGLGGMLTGANNQIAKILDPGQIKAMYDSGFEWGEYLGVKAPWETLKPPPPRP